MRGDVSEYAIENGTGGKSEAVAFEPGVRGGVVRGGSRREHGGWDRRRVMIRTRTRLPPGTRRSGPPCRAAGGSGWC